MRRKVGQFDLNELVENEVLVMWNTKRFCRTFIGIVIFLTSWINNFGHVTDGKTPSALASNPGSGNPGIGDFGSIGLFNARLNYTLPLLEVGGRGQVGYTIALPLNRLWVYEHRQHTTIGGNIYDYSVPVDGGWHNENLRYMPGKLLGTTRLGPENNSYPPLCNPNQQQNTVYALTRLSFVSSDGSEINLVSRNYGDTALPVNIQCNSSGDPISIIPSSRGTEFVSDDGSAVRFTSDQVITDAQFSGGWFKPSGYLYFKSGLHYRIVDGVVTWMRDRNGNKISFAYSGTNYSSSLVQVTDSNGRTINFSTSEDPTYGLHDQITYAGLGGEPKVIRVSYGSQANALRSGETLKTLNQLFGEECAPEHSNCPSTTPVDRQLVSSVWFPGNRQFRYFYNSYAELARVETPSGAAFEYDWGGSLEGGSESGANYPPPGYAGFPEISRQVLEKRTYSNGGSGNTYDLRVTISKSAPHEYSTNTVSSRTIKTFGTTSNLITKSMHRFYGSSVPPIGGSILNADSGAQLKGREYEAQYFDSDEMLVSRNLREWVAVSLSGPWADFRVTKSISIEYEAGNALASFEEIEYDGNGTGNFEYFSHLNAKRSKTYRYKVLDFSTAQTGSLAAISGMFLTSDLAAVGEADYWYDPNYKARGILGLVLESRVINPSNPNDVLGKSQFVHDETTYFDNIYTTTNWENPNSLLRGNVTTTRIWSKDTDTWIESHTMFDNFGNVRKVWDTSGDPARFVETEYSSTYNYAYPTKTKAPAPDPTGVHGTTLGSEINRTYDFNTGLLLSVTDDRGQAATTEYDALLRPIRINPPAGGSVSETIYNDTPGNIWVKRRRQIDAVNWAESTTYFDNLGRAFKSRTKDLQGDVMSQVLFDSFGRVENTSNPYRVDSGGNPTETVYWSKVRYDDRSRVVETYAPAPTGQTGNSLGTVEFGISDLTNLVGTYVVATDPSGRKSRAISGIYGLLRVDEATGIGGTVDQDLGTLANPNQPTSYSYNIKGELTKIIQGSQNRYFMYDSFGRLIRIRQPEQTPNTNLATTSNPENNSWTAAYSYDVFGNVTSMTDAKNTTITNQYDMASRPILRTYSDGTPQVEFFYDGKGLPSVPQYSKGALTKATSSVSEDRFTEFDHHGRLLKSEQITDGQTYPFTYKYNLSGGLIEQTYPSGRIVRNFLDADGGLKSVVTKTAADLTNKIVASNFDYSSTGAVKKMKLGNGLWETAQIDHLGQLTQVGLGTTSTNNSLFKIDYEYGELQTNGTVDATKNIGNIAKTTTTIPTTSFVQTFKYDAINRLSEAKETTGSTTNWTQVFGYDRLGNRTSFSETIGGVLTQNTVINHPTIDAANNRFTTGQGYVYDFNGNIVQDAEGRSFTFNGDDKQTEVRNTSTNAVIGQYFYDGSGARVKKVVPGGESTIFVYDAGGSLAGEYSTVAPTNPTTSYMTTDHLGSPRVITDKTGNVIVRRDFMPFGEELGAGIGPRTTSLKYAVTGSDNIRKRFTGYEKDDEAGLDFAEARMYQNRHGRFTAPDPLLGSSSASNPQTFNRYIYTGNDPVNYVDPGGLKFCRNGSGKVEWKDSCSSGESDVDNKIAPCESNVCSVHDGQINKGEFAFFNADTQRIERITNPTSDQSAQIAAATGTEVRASMEEIATQTASIITDFGLGVVQGIAGSACMGQCSALNPSSTDTIPQRIGQGVGAGIDFGLGLTALDLGGKGTGAALVTGQVEALAITVPVAATGLVLTIGSTIYASQILNAGMPTQWLRKTGMEENTSGTRPRKTTPVEDANGPHTTIKKDPDGNISGTETWKPNPRNPRGWDSDKRVDNNPKGKPHKGIPTPHTTRKGKTRPARKWEVPK